MKRHAAASGLLMALLSACTAGPDFRVPDHAMVKSPSANAPFHSGDEAIYISAPLPDHWWRLYEDARLDAYVAEALAANTDLRAADANLKRASYIVREAEAGRTIQTTISGGADISRIGGFTGPGSSYTYNLGAGVSYPLDLAGGIKRGIEAARANSEAEQAARDQVRVAVAAAVTRSYAAACSASGGRGTAFDVTRARAAVDQSAAAIPGVLASRQAALYELAALMGRAPADYPREAEECAAPPSLRQVIPIGDGAALLSRRPDVRAAERRLHAATATIGVETAELYPHISLGGSMGFAGPFSTFLSGNGFGGSLGPLLSWTFPNRSVAHARIAEAGASAEAASANFDGTVIEALRQTETALSAYAREADRNHALTLTQGDTLKASDQASRLYHFGRTNFIDVLSAEASLANAEATLAQSRATLVDRQVDLFLALGGGWTDGPEGTETKESSTRVKANAR